MKQDSLLDCEKERIISRIQWFLIKLVEVYKLK